MFTGIIETLAKVILIEPEGGNLHVTLSTPLAAELKIDQSVAHNGVCLTVIAITDNTYTVTAIDETLQKTNLNTLKVGDYVNLERAMILGARLDGHLVQGHVDQTGNCTSIKEKDGSWIFSFEYNRTQNNTTIEKGSITVDGVSLTVIDSGIYTFSVAIIPYTYEHTRFSSYTVGSLVNLEFDVVGKYVAKLMGMNNGE
ncbi:riboflavin synthase [Arenibacter sp. GZD96]|uniref:riboflavin synthase n=1 Tax=Aurantibrevibacter litoralis TaxID=3106030 RepID=UPI002AFEF7BE|nr:riboflavin synthase [Arenibacter sp. GZD-96]MEA1785768.1 riboflavin synthase [Arenibacter sp. GZD-96]